jgi:DNA-binding transcriptional regulator LsrR (DeoR family)
LPPARKDPKPRAVSPSQSRVLREEVIQAMANLLVVSADARKNLLAAEKLGRKVSQMLEDGRSGREIVSYANAATMRAQTSAMIHRVQAARHRAQQAQFKLAMSEGYTMAEIARTWGVSRQLVSRMVKEPTARRRS